MNGNERYELLMEITNVMLDLKYEVEKAAMDDTSICLDTKKGDVEVRFWVTVKKTEQ